MTSSASWKLTAVNRRTGVWTYELVDEETESRVDKAERRKDLRCSYCRPNRQENAKRKPKKDVHKTKRKR